YLDFLDKAIATLRHAIKLNPNFHQAYLVLGKLLTTQGKTDEAKACYARAKNEFKAKIAGSTTRV
ncbi:MAG: Plant specific mitochondrial import receptor subunit, partial [Cyanobacteriota bacterium]